MQKISITFHISKLSIEKFECNTFTASLETLQECFYQQNILHWMLTIKLLRNHLYWYINEMQNKHKNTFSPDIA